MYWRVDDSSTQIKKLARAFRSAPKRAMAATLTKLSYEAKDRAPSEIDRAMTLRAPGFVARAIRYSGAQPSRLQSVWGMQPKPRFSALAAQEYGRTDSERAATLLSRGGSLRNKVRPSMRLKPSTKIIKAEDFKRPPVSEGQMVAVLRKMKYKGLVEFTKWGKASSRSGGLTGTRGIYTLVGTPRWKSARLVHALDNIPQQRKRPWMASTNRKLLNSGAGKKAWASAVSNGIRTKLRGG